MTSERIGNYRWRIVMLLFAATTINYIDRNVLSFTMIDEDFKREMIGLAAGQPISDADNILYKEWMGYVDSAFKWAYAIGYVLAGWLIDRIGTRRGYAISMFVWSIAGVLNAFVGSLGTMSVTRFLLGLGESGNFPSAIKTVAEWFPKRERSFANGIFNAGTNVGIIITALTVPWLTLNYGWRVSFIVTGLLGFVMLGIWWTTYRRPGKHPQVTQAELDYINSDQEKTPEKKIPWASLLTYRQTWAFAMGKFMTDPVWWFYLTWLPDFFNSNEALDQKLDLKSIGIPFLIIYLVSDVGSIFFGWLSTKFIEMGWSINRARKTTMLICAVCVFPIFIASTTSNIYIAVALISLATAAHQGWSANMYTFASDLFPRQAVASVTGIGGMCGAIGGALFAAVTGIIIGRVGYEPLFIIASGTYIVALAVIHFIVPKMQPANVEGV
ncbi:MFS transporter [Telluribacter sp.]|jgi:ACS family hexuronate transporter-like MFS transporter|uniref:MFS transporter n=1 Tax=Telluribacter sp. TaxID=1978767 RepID=UPI002E14D92F|nr:MFS transporter [Telluribacter sp.]